MGTREISPQTIHSNLLPPSLPDSGKGAAVAVLDSGFCRKHPALRSVTIPEAKSFVGGDPNVDAVGHGTECSSVIVRNSWEGHVQGIAPNAQLFVGQIIRPEGTGTIEALCAGLEWAATLHVDVVAIPLGVLRNQAMLRRAVEKVLCSGARIVAAAGNPFNGQKGCLYPAAYPDVISVGATTFADAYRSWEIPPTFVGDTRSIPLCTTSGGWTTGNDTSHATMLVAGLFCLLGTSVAAEQDKREDTATRGGVDS
jgi:subtilisin family serine protease